MLMDDIYSLIESGIKSQQEMLEKLQERGYKLTQSTLSRFLKKKKIGKKNGVYDATMPPSLAVHITRWNKVPPNLLVIHTTPGLASAIASIIDKSLVEKGESKEFIGTIAGDDAIFVAVNLNGQDYEWVIGEINRVLLR